MASCLFFQGGLEVLGMGEREGGISRTRGLSIVLTFPSDAATTGVTVGRCSCLSKGRKHMVEPI